MNSFAVLPRVKGFRFLRAIISYAVWAYHRFNLSTANVEDLLAECGTTASREAIRLWVNRFGRHFALIACAVLIMSLSETTVMTLHHEWS